MAELKDVVAFCDERVRRAAIADFPGAENGLQFENSGKVTKIGAAVDAGIEPFKAAAAARVDFLIVHHGMCWTPLVPCIGPLRRKLELLFTHDLAVYGSHLPLDCHPEIGNNAILARKLQLEVSGWWLPYQGNPIAARVDNPGLCRQALRERLQTLFPDTLTAIECGPAEPQSIGLLTGSGHSCVPHMAANGIDTLITGELKQGDFNLAQEWGLNLYLGGHYATEVFGVQALAAEIARHFDLDWTFLPTHCPL